MVTGKPNEGRINFKLLKWPRAPWSYFCTACHFDANSKFAVKIYTDSTLRKFQLEKDHRSWFCTVYSTQLCGASNTTPLQLLSCFISSRGIAPHGIFQQKVWFRSRFLNNTSFKAPHPNLVVKYPIHNSRSWGFPTVLVSITWIQGFLKAMLSLCFSVCKLTTKVGAPLVPSSKKCGFDPL